MGFWRAHKDRHKRYVHTTKVANKEYLVVGNTDKPNNPGAEYAKAQIDAKRTLIQDKFKHVTYVTITDKKVLEYYTVHRARSKKTKNMYTYIKCYTNSFKKNKQYPLWCFSLKDLRDMVVYRDLPAYRKYGKVGTY